MVEFHIFADWKHGDKSVIHQHKSLLEKIINQSASKSIVYFSEYFAVGEETLINSVLQKNKTREERWQENARINPKIIYDEIFDPIRQNNIKVHPITPKEGLSLIYDNVTLSKRLFDVFLETYKKHYSKDKPDIVLISVGKLHAEYFKHEIKKLEKNGLIFTYDLK
jgi:hypothetical protein